MLMARDIISWKDSLIPTIITAVTSSTSKMFCGLVWGKYHLPDVCCGMLGIS